MIIILDHVKKDPLFFHVTQHFLVESKHEHEFDTKGRGDCHLRLLLAGTKRA